MTRTLSDFPIRTVGDFQAVIITSWKDYIYEHNVARMGRPLRHGNEDAWILTTSVEDAHRLAKLAQRNFLPEDLGFRERYVTTKREPTFAAAMLLVPNDVAIYFSTSSDIDDQALIQKLHPCPPHVNERISWSAKGYHVRSGHGDFRGMVSPAPRTFGTSLERVRAALVDAVGPGFDTSLPYLNASPVLAALLRGLTRPAAEAVSHWMGRLGTSEPDTLTIPSKGIVSDLPIEALLLQSNGVNMRASFLLNLGDVRISDMQIDGLHLTDTMGTALDAQARRGELMLSQIVGLPGADDVPVLSLTRHQRSWTARLSPVSVAIRPPTSRIPFEAPEQLAAIEAEGNDIRGDVEIILAKLGRERASFILYCVHDGNSGKSFDVSGWMPDGTETEIRLRDRSYIAHSTSRSTVSDFLGRCA